MLEFGVLITRISVNLHYIVCGGVIDPANRPRVFIGGAYYLNSRGPDIFWVGAYAIYQCETELSNRLIHHPTVCQPDGEWKPASFCESKSSIDLYLQCNSQSHWFHGSWPVHQRLGGAVVTCSPLTAMARVLPWSHMWDGIHPSQPMPGGFDPSMGFSSIPLEGLKIVRLGTASN